LIDSNSYKVNTNVIFKFKGNPDQIYFYSGEVGKKYENRQRTNASNATNVFSFNSSVSPNNALRNLSVLLSNDFNGIMDSTSIYKASWKDISSRITWASTSTPLFSGIIDVTAFQTERDTLYIAFKYLRDSPSLQASRWTLSNFVWNNIFPEGKIYPYNTNTNDIRLAGFQALSIKGATIKWAINSTLMINEGLSTNLSSLEEDWVISKAFNMSRIAPDLATPIKNTSQLITNYAYKFTSPGIYNVVFVASNVNISGTQEVQKALTIQITN